MWVAIIDLIPYCRTLKIALGKLVTEMLKTEKTGDLLSRSPDELNAFFKQVCQADLERLGLPDSMARWLFADRLHARGARKVMGFQAFEGPSHLQKFIKWQSAADRKGYFSSDLADELMARSVASDRRVLEYHGLQMPDTALQNVALNNTQDYILQRAYHVPERNAIRILLDFGPGYGRMANLAYNTQVEADRVQGYIAIEGIPSTYFTQYAYYKGLGLKVWDYYEYLDETLSQDTIAEAIGTFDVVHLPTWRFDLVPDGVVDMVTCVQVLKEIPGDLVPYAMKQFSRVSKSSGALYIRDHLQFHNPNNMPIDILAQSQGYALEFAPQVKDRAEIHGLPRIWRKVDPTLFL